MANQIEVRKLSKNFNVPVRAAGISSAFRSLFKKTYTTVEAVKEVDFTIKKGEIVGFLGPNGAGKTTTLKMLSGLLYPTSGTIDVAGFKPWEKKRAYLGRIAMVMGNKSQLLWDIPPAETFQVLGEIYRISSDKCRKTVGDLAELLEVNTILDKPVRNLSLGERMKCELIAALLHQPDVLFLDEPTLGLDISSQVKLRTFILDYNKKYEATILLTSHYVADISALCTRVIFINSGTLIYDGLLSALMHKIVPYKFLKISTSSVITNEQLQDLSSVARVVGYDEYTVSLNVDRANISQVTSQLLKKLAISDISIEDPPLEAVVNQLYADGPL